MRASLLLVPVLVVSCSTPEWRALPFELPADAPEGLEAVQRDAWQAREDLLAEPEDEELIVWYGRRVGYTGDYLAAAEIYTEGLRVHSDSAKLLRHRGHRWISLRHFDRAVEDLTRASQLVAGTSDEIEPDGIPNARNIPTSTLHTNIWYHLALAHYCRGEFTEAQRCWAECLAAARNPDMECAARYWLFHAATRAGDAEAAAAALAPVRADWNVIENHVYHRLLLLYRGDLEESALESDGDPIKDATLGYGLARWAVLEHRTDEAGRRLRALADSGSAAFGCIAAEADLAGGTAR